jgi:hypothetical protein
MTFLAELGLLGNMFYMIITGCFALMSVTFLVVAFVKRDFENQDELPIGERSPWPPLKGALFTYCTLLFVVGFLFFATRFVKLVWAL